MSGNHSDKEFLNFIYQRLHNVYGENENYDYMLKLKAIADKQSTGVYTKF